MKKKTQCQGKNLIKIRIININNNKKMDFGIEYKIKPFFF